MRNKHQFSNVSLLLFFVLVVWFMWL
jgi:hypothetical protein